MHAEVRGHTPEYEDDLKEELDVEEAIAKVEDECSEFITSDQRDQLDKIFDAARKSYEDSAVTADWNQLFEELKSALMGSADEDDINQQLANFVKKADSLG